jgi:hypothetical protein
MNNIAVRFDLVTMDNKRINPPVKMWCFGFDKGVMLKVPRLTQRTLHYLHVEASLGHRRR